MSDLAVSADLREPIKLDLSGGLGTALGSGGPTPGEIQKAKTESDVQQGKLRAAGDELVKSTEQSTAARHALQLQRPPMPPPQPAPEQKNTNPVEAWGSLAMSMAMLGSAFTRRPLVNSLNAAADVMKAYQAKDAAAYKTAFDKWKAESDYSLRLYEYQHESYKDAMDMIATDQKGALALFNAKAAALGDDPMKRFAEAAKLPEIVALADERKARTDQMMAQTANARRTGEVNQEVLDAGVALRANPADPEAQRRYKDARAAQADLSSPRGGVSAGVGREQEMERAVQEKDRQWLVDNGGDQVPPDIHYRHRLEVERDMKAATSTPTAKNQAAQAFADDVQQKTGKPPSYQDWVRFSQETSGSQTGKLSEDAVKLMARQYELGDMGVITSLPRGGPARIQVENQIAEDMKGMDDGAAQIVMNRLRMAEAKSAATTAGRVTMNTELYSQEAKGAGQEVIRTSKLFPRTDIPLVNQALRAYETNTGDPNVIRFGVAMNSLVNAYGKMSNPTGTGIHDADKARLANILDTKLAQGQIEEGVAQVIREGEIVSNAARQAQAEVLRHIMPGAPGQQQTGATPAAADTTPSGPAKVESQAAYDALPPGAHYLGPDGKERIKP